MNLLSRIDGQKTYILTIIGGIFALIHFFVIGDYHASSFIQLGQDSAFMAMIAALRHGVSKIGNQGSVGKTVVVLILSLLLCHSVFAQTASNNTNTPATSITGTISTAFQSLDVPVQITKIKDTGFAVNTGFFYSISDKNIYSTYSYSPFGGKALGTWGTWDYVSIGYADPNILIAGTGLVVNVGVLANKWGITIPASIQSIINSTSFGVTPIIGIERVGSKNRVTGGPGIYGKITF